VALTLTVMVFAVTGCMSNVGSATKATQTLVLSAESQPTSPTAPGPSSTAPRSPTASAATVTPTAAALVAQLPRLPAVVGKTQTEATRILKAAGFTVSVTKEQASHGVTGTVLRMSPGAGATVEPGSRVTLVVAQVVTEDAPAESNCTPGYDPCLPPASDYDCAGGSGNGPKYVQGPVRVTGSDPYRLDADHDGIGCE